MNFQQLKYYTVLCEAGSFSKAAESLFIYQQGLMGNCSQVPDAKF